MNRSIYNFDVNGVDFEVYGQGYGNWFIKGIFRSPITGAKETYEMTCNDAKLIDDLMRKCYDVDDDEKKEAKEIIYNRLNCRFEEANKSDLKRMQEGKNVRVIDYPDENHEQWREYYVGGKLKKIETFNLDNELDGEYKEFDEQGNIVKGCEYINGEIDD